MSKFFGAIIIFLFVSGILIFLLTSKSELVLALENKTWDFRVALTSRKGRADKRIKLIDIDQVSLDFFEKEYSLTWPLPRNTYNYVISFLNKAQAKGLAFDMLFTESSAQAVEADAEFAKATACELPIVTAVSLDSLPREMDQDKFKMFSNRQLTSNIPISILRNGDKFGSIILPIPELISSSTAFGNVQAEPDSDGVFRHYKPGGVVNNIPVLSLPFALYHATNGLSSDFKYRDLTIRLHGGRNTYQSYSLASIIQSQVLIQEGKRPIIDPAVFKDAWVVLGSTAPGLLDLRATSLEERGGGLHFVAAVLDNLINNNFIKTTPNELVYVVSLMLTALCLFATLQGVRLSLHILRIVSIILVFFGFSFFLAFQGIWLPVVVPFTAILLTAFLGVALQYKLEGKQHLFIRNAFKFYVSPSVVEQIVTRPDSLKLGGQKKEVSIFFSDIVGFTAISEKLDPQLLVKMLNDYLSLMTKIIQDHGGTVDKYVGDAVMAFWNAPLACEDHATRAVQAAINCQLELTKHKNIFEKIYSVFPDTRIGINTAEVNVGNFGSKDRFNYTLIGDGVNLASRLEGANKNFGTRILFSEQTKNKLSDRVIYRAVADLVVLGKSESVRVYEPFYQQNDLDFNSFKTAFAALEVQDYQKAKAILESIKSDPVSSKYLSAIHNLDSSKKVTLWHLGDK